MRRATATLLLVSASSTTAEEGVPIIDAPRCPANYDCPGPCFEDRAMDCTPDMDRTVACCFSDACYSSHFGTRYTAPICCGESADDPRTTCNATGGPPAPPPPGPRRCFDRAVDGRNQALSASWTETAATSTSARGSSDVARYYEEGASGNWAADTFVFGSSGCECPFGSCACGDPGSEWKRALYPLRGRIVPPNPSIYHCFWGQF